MVDQSNAITLVKNKFNGYNIKKLREAGKAFLFLCESKDREIVPNKMVVAVNKVNGKIGMSVFSPEEAVSKAMR